MAGFYLAAGYGHDVGIGGGSKSNKAPQQHKKSSLSPASTPNPSAAAAPGSATARSVKLSPSNSSSSHGTGAMANLLAGISSSGPSSTSGYSSTSRASSRRSSVEHPIIEDSPQKKAVREAFLKKDLAALRKLSTKGFVNDSMRRLVWPVLLGVPAVTLPEIREEDILRRRQRFTTNEKIDEESENIADEAGDNEKRTEDKPEPIQHGDEFQVQLDVNRSFVHFPMADDLIPEKFMVYERIDEARDRRRVQLSSLIVNTLRKHPALHYFQGYHDIISIILLVCDDDQELAVRLTERISLFHIRDSMMAGLDPVVGYLRLLKRILTQADPTLAAAVEQASSLPYFSLSWVLTLMAHDLTSVELISRIFDFLLAHNPAMISYLCAAIIMAKRSDVTNLDPDIASDPATMHAVLSKLPSLAVEEPNPSPSNPGSPYLQPTRTNGIHSRNASFSSDRSFLDSELDMPVLFNSIKSSLSDAFQEVRGLPPKKKALPPPIILENLFVSALHLYELFPPTHKEVAADSIFGPKSVVFTWDNRDLAEGEAEMIVTEGKDVIIAEPIEKTKEEEQLDQEYIKRKQLQRKDLLRDILAKRRSTILMDTELDEAQLARQMGYGGLVTVTVQEAIEQKADEMRLQAMTGHKKEIIGGDEIDSTKSVDAADGDIDAVTNSKPTSHDDNNTTSKTITINTMKLSKPTYISAFTDLTPKTPTAPYPPSPTVGSELDDLLNDYYDDTRTPRQEISTYFRPARLAGEP